MEALIVQALAERKRFTMLRGIVPTDMLTPEITTVLAWMEYYFGAYPEAQTVHKEDLQMLVRMKCPDKDQAAVTCALVERLIGEPIEKHRVDGLVGQLYEMDAAGKAAALLSQYQNGGDVDILTELRALSSEALKSRGAALPDDYVDTPISEILAAAADDRGLKFRRHPALQRAIAGLTGGATILIAGRPDKGKTSFVADILTDFAPQAAQLFGANRPILWLCNEGSGARIKPRLYQAALDMNIRQIQELSNAGTLEGLYSQAIGAPIDFIRIKNAHGMSMAQVEQILELMKPSIVVYDMLANMRLGRGKSSGNKAEDLEAVAQIARELAVMYDHVALQTAQISAEGDDMLYPSYSALKDSKTALQGAVDTIIMLGSLNNPSVADLRGISTPKNKFAVPGQPSCVTVEAVLDGANCRVRQV